MPRSSMTSLVCAAGALAVFLSTVRAATAPYRDDFDDYPQGPSPSNFVTTATGNHDDGAAAWQIVKPGGTTGVYRNQAFGNMTWCSAAVPITNLGQADFHVSTTFASSFYAPNGISKGRTGLAVFSNNPDFKNAGYQVSYQVFGPGGGHAPENGQLNLYRLGHQVTGPVGPRLPVVPGATYTMTVTGVHSPAGLTLTAILGNGSDSISVSYVDAAPLSGEYFGYYTEQGGSTQNSSSLTTGFDNFVVTKAAPFIVTNTNATGPGSLGQAIVKANAQPGADRIHFNIPGPGVHKINVGQTALPEVTDTVMIDGYTEPGASPNTLTVGNDAVILIQIDGGNDAELKRDGIVLMAPGCVIRGLSITGFVGTTQKPCEPCAPVLVGGHAIRLKRVNTTVAGNFIGVLPNGNTMRGNTKGVLVEKNGNTIGGSTPEARNVISGNVSGITLSAVATVAGNYIGTNASGTERVENRQAVLCNATIRGALVGGTTQGAGNLISGNAEGVVCGEFFWSGRDTPVVLPGNSLAIKGNTFGLRADGTAPLANEAAIVIGAGSNNTIGGSESGAANLIAGNTNAVLLGGVLPGTPATTGTANQVLSNSIYANGGPAIDINADGAATPNDPADADDGFNHLQNSPTISSATIENGTALITGTLHSTSNTTFTIQLFSESKSLAQPVQSYLGSTTLTTDSTGNGSFSAAFPVPDPDVTFNATATDPDGNTSEFASNAGPLLNLSTRGRVGSGEDVLIGGVLTSSPGEALIFRALGPSLQNAGIDDALADPILEMYDSFGTLIGSNDNWKDSPQRQEIEATGIAPTHDLESAMLGNPGCTVIVRSKTGAPGVALVEAYHDFGVKRVQNLSTRGAVDSGENVLIGGFILGHDTTRIVVRAVGPSLAAEGVTAPLNDPVLELRDSSGTLIASNDDWKQNQESDLRAVRLDPSADSESAIFTRLEAGAYTAIVRGKDDSAGVALVEIYNLR